MKRFVVLLVFGLMLFGGVLTAAAADPGFSVEGGYFVGSLDNGYDDYDTNGFTFRVEAPIAENFGVLGDAASLTADMGEEDLKFTDWNLYGTYTLPVGVDGLAVKALLGYGSASVDPDEDWTPEHRYYGWRAGLAAQYTVDKFTLDGQATFGIGNELDWSDEETYDDATASSFRLAGSYEITPGVALEAGYSCTKLEAEDEGCEWDFSGFFAGAKATF